MQKNGGLPRAFASASLISRVSRIADETVCFARVSIKGAFFARSMMSSMPITFMCMA